MIILFRRVLLYATMMANGKTTLLAEKDRTAWKERSVIWLSGVRRAGKTVLCQSLPDVEYFDCELPEPAG